MDQELVAQVVSAVLAQLGKTDSGAPGPIPAEVSGRHVHLSPEHFGELFGAGKEMEKRKDISQPGQFLSNHRVRLIGPKGTIDRVAVLGPCRKATQIEISRTDAVALGIDPPVRQSGDTAGSADVYLQVGDNMLHAPSSTIIAARHLHMTPAQAERYGVANGQMVDVLLEGGRPIILREVLVRADDTGELALHIDFDEANAAGLGGAATCRILQLDIPAAAAAPVGAAAAVAAPAPTVVKPDAGEKTLQAEGGRPLLVTEAMVADLDAQGVRVVCCRGRVLVTALAKEALRERNIQLLQQ